MTKICLPPGETGLDIDNYSGVSEVIAEPLLTGCDVGHEASACDAPPQPETVPAALLAGHRVRVTRWLAALRWLFAPVTNEDRRRGGGWGGDDD